MPSVNTDTFQPKLNFPGFAECRNIAKALFHCASKWNNSTTTVKPGHRAHKESNHFRNADHSAVIIPTARLYRDTETHVQSNQAQAYKKSWLLYSDKNAKLFFSFSRRNPKP